MTYQALEAIEAQDLPIGESPGFYGGTAAAPTGGTGAVWPSLAEGDAALTLKPVTAPAPVKAGDDGLVVVPVRRLYDRAPEFYASELMHGRIPAPFVALNTADAERLGVVDGDLVAVQIDGATAEVLAVVDEYAPQGVALLPLYLDDSVLPQVPAAGRVQKIAVAAAAD
jgi:hypothetical protein